MLAVRNEIDLRWKWREAKKEGDKATANSFGRYHPILGSS